jgi:hypothetical protein
MEPAEPYHGDDFNGSWAAEWVRNEVVDRLRVYEMVVERLLSAIGDPGAEANRLATSYWDRRMAEPSDGSEEPADIAEQAHDMEIDAYLELFALRQAALNLSAAGLFHLFEQTTTGLGRAWTRTTSATIPRLEKWLAGHLGVVVQDQPFWPVLRELRLVANVVKHGEGDSAEKLREVNPALFEHPGSPTLGFPLSFPVSAALAGDDIFVTDADLMRYVKSVKDYYAFLEDHLAGKWVTIPRLGPAPAAWTLRFGPSPSELAWVVQREGTTEAASVFPPQGYEDARLELIRLASTDRVEAVEFVVEIRASGPRVLRKVYRPAAGGTDE